jgi:hypothetical protein
MIKSLIATYSSKFAFPRLVKLLLLMLGMVIFSGNAYAAQVVLNWTQLSDPVTGYKIYYGSTSGNYTQSIDVGNVINYTIGNLASGSTYYIAATSHDAAGNESGFSNEVIAMIPAGQQYTLAVGKSGTGTGTVSGAGINCGAVCSGSYAPGTDVILTASADSGSVFAGWSGGGGSGSYETVVNAATSVTATFTKVYSITATSDSNGSIIPSSNPPVSQASNGSTTIKIVTVNQGANQSFTLTPNAGYYLANLQADGVSVGAPGTYTFSNVTADHTLTATFAVNGYTITASAGTGGSVSPSGATTVNSGGSQTYTITPATGYQIAGVTVDGTSVGAVSTYTFSNVTANHTISATFTINTYTITASSGANGSISPTGSTNVNYGASLTYTITPATGYHIAGVTVDGASAGAVPTYTFSSVTANHTISATFAVNTYTITASSGANGSISPAGATTVNSGASQTFSITPSAGYQIAAVTVDGVSAGVISSYTLTNITANHTISASFAASSTSYTLSAVSSRGGSISPRGSTTVKSGGSQTYTFSPNSGYHIADVKVDGVSVGAVTSYTFSNVIANHTISANFSNKSYTISASSGTGGSISPSGATTVYAAASQTLSITPSAGYQIAGVTVDGVSVGAVSTYTFSNVTAGHTIAATFAVKTYTISASSGTGGSISPAGATAVNYGGSKAYSITPGTGYNIAGVTVDGVSVGAVSSYTFSNVATNHTIAASFVNATIINSGTGTWINNSIASQSAIFTASFDLIPNANNIDTVTGFSTVPAAAFTDLAAIIRFNPSGVIDVMNVSSYAANVVMPYSAGNVYHVRMRIDVPNHRYDVYVTPPGGAETQLASGYAFRSPQAAVSVLNNIAIYGAVGSHQLLNLSVTTQ